MQELTFEQVEEVAGGVGPLGGAALGGGAYLVNAATTGSFSWGGLAGSMVAGGITSGMSALAGGGFAATGIWGISGAAAGGGTSVIVDHMVQ